MAAHTLFQFPSAIKEAFLQSKPVPFSDGSVVSPEEIWRFLNEDGPRRFPHAYQHSQFYLGRFSEDTDFFSGIKYQYLKLTLRDRVEAAHQRGEPIVLVQGGQSFEVYFAAGAIPLRPGLVRSWAIDGQEGINVRQADLWEMSILEKGRRTVGVEACNMLDVHQAIRAGAVHVDLIAPYCSLRCSDMAYLVESHRQTDQQIPLQLIDFPLDTPRTSPWAVDLVAQELRKLAAKLGELTGTPLSDDTLRSEIKRFNEGRRITREFEQIWQSAEYPPVNSVDFIGIERLGNEPTGDVTAWRSILEQARDEVKERVSKGIRGKGLAENPVRLYVCGSCVGANATLVDQMGGAIVGHDDQMSVVFTDVEEEGDPYVNLARGILSYPYEQPTKERARWLVDQVRRTRADGLVFIYNWGCNYQSASARLVADIVKKEAGIPTMIIVVDKLGKSETNEQSQNRLESFIELLQENRS